MFSDSIMWEQEVKKKYSVSTHSALTVYCLLQQTKHYETPELLHSALTVNKDKKINNLMFSDSIMWEQEVKKKYTTPSNCISHYYFLCIS